MIDLNISMQYFYWIFNIALAIYVIVSNRTNVKDGQMQQVRNDLTRLEERISHLPSTDEIRILSNHIERLGAQIHAIATVQTTIERTVDRINEYLLESKK